MNGTDVRVLQRAERSGFLFESLPESRIAGDMREEDLDGDRAIQASVDGLVNLAHPACAEPGGDCIWAEAGAGTQSHVIAQGL